LASASAEHSFDLAFRASSWLAVAFAGDAVEGAAVGGVA
jgi:hypothetical protein